MFITFFFSRKDNSFNYKVVNWGGDENRMSFKVEPTDFSGTEILDDDAIEQIGQEVNDLIELLDDGDDIDDDNFDDNSTAIRYPGLASNLSKRNHADSGMFYYFISIVNII